MTTLHEPDQLLGTGAECHDRRVREPASRRSLDPGRTPVAGRWLRATGSQRHTPRLRTARAVAAVLLFLVPLLTGAGSVARAPAGIVIEPDHVGAGARDVTLVFRMTDDDAAAPAVGFKLVLPTGRPLVGVTAPAPPGWTAELTRTVLPTPAPSADGPVREVVSAVEWTATAPRAAGAMKFALHVDLMPEGAGPVRLQAACTDAAGHTVDWADSWAEGSPKPAHDALTLPLGAAPRQPVAGVEYGDHHGAGAAAALPAGAITPAGIATTVGVLLATSGALVALLTLLARRQRSHLEPHSARDRDS